MIEFRAVYYQIEALADQPEVDKAITAANIVVQDAQRHSILTTSFSDNKHPKRGTLYEGITTFDKVNNFDNTRFTTEIGGITELKFGNILSSTMPLVAGREEVLVCNDTTDNQTDVSSQIHKLDNSGQSLIKLS